MPEPRTAADTTGVPATDVSVALLTEATHLGVRDLVLCPGSRSQALALVAAELERVGAVRLHVRIDERSAAFFALGLAVETGRPVPIITTSGTAVANLHPAMLEAFHSGVPLIALTADRPAELLGIGANQATRQPGIFGSLIEGVDVAAPEGGARAADEAADARALAARIATARGPLHVNLAFRDPLSAPVPDLSALFASADETGHEPGEDSSSVTLASSATPEAAATTSPVGPTLEIDAGDGIRTVVIAGAGAGKAAEQAAHDGGWPLIAEATSGARFGRNLVIAYRDLLRDSSPVPGLRERVERVLVFGHPTLSREVPALIAREGVRAIAVGPTGGEPYNPGHAIGERVDAVRIRSADRASDPEAFAANRAWLRHWAVASRELVEARSSDPMAPDVAASRSEVLAERVRFGREELAVARERVDRDILVDAVWRATWPHDRLVLGASRLIRDLDARAPGKPIAVHANRGLAGIDGTIATALGIAVASQARGDRSAAGVTRVLVGDLTFLHDAGSLLVGQGGEPAPRIQVIVGNDGGGTIFDGLEVARTAPAGSMERVLYTPQRADLERLAQAYGWAYAKAGTRAELEAALTAQAADRVVIEVPLPRG